MPGSNSPAGKSLGKKQAQMNEMLPQNKQWSVRWKKKIIIKERRKKKKEKQNAQPEAISGAD